MKRRRPLLWTVFVVVVLLVGVLAFRRTLFDDRLESDADLTPVEYDGNFDSPDNGYPQLQEAFGMIARHSEHDFSDYLWAVRETLREKKPAEVDPDLDPEDEWSPSFTLTEEEAEEFFAENRPALDKFLGAAQFSELTFPVGDEEESRELKDALKEIVLVARTFAERALKLEQWDRCQEIANAIFTLGSRYAQQARVAYHYLLAGGIKVIGAKLWYRRVIHEPLTAAESIEICRLLESTESNPTTKGNLIRHMYASTLADPNWDRARGFRLFDERESPLPEWCLYKPNRTRNRLADRTRELIAAINAENTPRSFQPRWSRPNSWWGELVHGNTDGEQLVDLLTNNKLLDVMDKSAISFRGVRLVIALRAYELEHSKLPDHLEALVPTYMTSVPLDPFDGKAFRYSRERARVWSIGIEGKNKEGVRSEYLEEGDQWDSWYPTFLVHPEEQK